MAKINVSMQLNGNAVSAEVEPRTLLIHYLRESLNVTGPHIGCDTSHCGACTVDIDGKSVKSCTIFAVQAAGAEVLTSTGRRFTEASIGMALATRNLMDHLRSTGDMTSGPKAFTPRDRSNFLSALDNAVVRLQRARFG